MSFSSDCKLELVKQIPTGCCLASRIYGYFMFFSRIGSSAFQFKCEQEQVLRHLCDCLEEYGIPVRPEWVSRGKRMNILNITDPIVCEELYEDLGFANSAPSYALDRGFLICDDCPRNFVAGAFLAAGSVSDPGKGYHLEFVTHRKKVAKGLCSLLEEMGFRPSIAVRGYDTVVYFKSSEQIEDLLTTMGAAGSSLELMEAKIYKDVRNQVTRRVNCENGNMERAAKAAAGDAALFREFLERGGDRELDDSHLEIARLRIDRPELSLAELAAEAGGITKSGVNHRLRKIRETAREYLDSLG